MILPIGALRDRPTGGAGAPDAEPADDQETALAGGHGGRAIVCIVCGERITSTDALTEIGGRSEHTFVNPHCIVFKIRTFASAPGCVSAGRPSTEWSWFPGCSWQIQLCRGCAAHLGWLFRGAEQAFWGLIADRVIEQDDDQ